MKKLLTQSILYVSILLTICNCTLKPIEVPVPNTLATKSKLVLYSELKANSDTVYFTLSRTIPLFKSGNPSIKTIDINSLTLSNKDEKFTFNSNDLFPFKYDKEFNKFYYFIVLPNVKIEEGKTYTLEITSDNNDTISGTTTIPAYAPSNANLILDSNYYFNSFTNKGSYYYNFQLEFQDNPNETNYYSASYIDNLTNEESYQFIKSDLNRDGQILFSDNIYINNDLDLKFQITDYTFVLKTIDEHYFKYNKKYENIPSEDDLFSEPINMYSNVKGGLGCVCSSNRKSLIIKK